MAKASSVNSRTLPKLFLYVDKCLIVDLGGKIETNVSYFDIVVTLFSSMYF